MRAVPVVFAVAALVLVAAASARDPRAPLQRYTPADMKLARSIVLTRADLGAGWIPAPKSKPAPPCSKEPDESNLVQTARLDRSFAWRDGVTSVGSEVDVFKTAAQARRDWSLSTLPLIRDCLLENARWAFGKNADVRLHSARALASPGLGERSVHLRFVFDVRSKRSSPTVPVVTDLVEFGVGRITVVVHSFSLRQPLAGGALAQLSQVVAKRLRGAPGSI